MKPVIVLVEDDQSIGYMLSEYLKLKNYDVTWMKSPAECLQRIREVNPDLFILDITLPEMDGFQLAARIRSQNEKIPLIFLTARSLKVDVLKGFSMGADDYIIKPVDEEELVARIQAVLKRYQTAPREIKSETELGNTILHFEKQEIDAAGVKEKLTRREAQLLNLFFQRPDELITTDEILKEIWGKNDFFNRRSMDVFISRLRKKIANDGSLSIENIHGQGFVLKTT